MRYSVLGFNQEELIKYDIDMTDVLLLDYIQKALSQPSMIKTTKDEQPYVWLQHSKILEDLPILNIKESMLKKRIAKLVELELIQSINIANEHGRGSRSYYTITEQFEALQMTECNKLSVVERPSVKNYTPNNKLINDNKLNKSISKDIDNKEVEWFLKNYHETCVSLPRVMKLSDKRRKAIIKILNKFSKDDILDCFDKIEESDFLIGNNDRGWKADIDFILREDKFINILEGKYGGKKKRSTTHDRISESGDLYVEHSNKRKEVAKYGTEKF